MSDEPSSISQRDRPLRVGVVGVGHLGSIHARVYSEMPDIELVGVADTDRAQVEKVARDYSNESVDVAALSDFADLVDLVDAVSIVVPTPRHLEAAKPFLEAGKSVLVEKPLAASLIEADEIIRLAEQNACTLQVGHIERFNPVLAGALPHIDRPVFIECDRIHPFNLRSTDVSVILDLMIHDIDLILHIIDAPVESIDALGAAVLSPTDDLATARVLFENGCVAMVKTSRVALSRSRKIRIFCARSYLSLDLVERTGFRIALGKGYDAQDFMNEMGRISAPEGEAAFLAKYLQTEVLAIPKYQPLQAELSSFVDAAVAGTEPAVTGQQGRRAMAAADAIDRSIKHHRERVAKLLGP